MLSLFNPAIETMEGAAVYYTAASEGIDAVGIRAVSNFVEERDRDSWEVSLALRALPDAVERMLEILEIV